MEERPKPNAWQGGKEAFAELREVLLSTAVVRASAHYSVVGHAKTLLDRAHYLAAAKTCLREAMHNGNGMWPEELDADQFDVLSTVALRGIKVLGIGLGPLAPSPKLALSLAEEGLRRCGEDTKPHTPALLSMDKAEGLWFLGKKWEAHDAAAEARRLLERGIPDQPQRVRVMKRLGAHDLKEGRKGSGSGWALIGEALELAREVAPGQAEKIEGLKRHLRRPWYHPLRWAVVHH